MKKLLLLPFVAVACLLTLGTPDLETHVFDNAALPDGFVYIKTENPNIQVDLRYAGTNNFTGSIVDGYLSDQAAIITANAASALSEIQAQLEREGLGLLVYDAYRPAKAVRFFVEWAKNDDFSTKEEYYPNLKKSTLTSSGYIAKKSAHSRGSAVDLTIIDLSTGEPLDMGSNFDLLDKKSWHGTSLITDEQSQNRKKLKSVMETYGFSAYSKEWWHYTYKDELFPDEYFDFDVE